MYIPTLYEIDGHCSLVTDYEYAGSRFKVKVGLNQEDDIRRVSLVRQEVGDDKIMVSNPSDRMQAGQELKADKNIVIIVEYYLCGPPKLIFIHKGQFTSLSRMCIEVLATDLFALVILYQ